MSTVEGRICTLGAAKCLRRAKEDGKRNSPGTGLTDSYPWPGEVLSETLIVLREATELKLGHRLFVRTGVHRSQVRSGTGRGSKVWTGQGREDSEYA